MGAPAPPRAEKKCWGVIYRENCKCTPNTPSAPPGRGRVNFWTFFGDLEVGVVDWVVLGRLLRATSRKGRQIFREKKCTPDIILATPMTSNGSVSSQKWMFSVVVCIGRSWCTVVIPHPQTRSSDALPAKSVRFTGMTHVLSAADGRRRRPLSETRSMLSAK